MAPLVPVEPNEDTDEPAEKRRKPYNKLSWLHELEKPCSCAFKQPCPHPQCSECGGRGVVLTDNGRDVLDFVTRWIQVNPTNEHGFRFPGGPRLSIKGDDR